MKDLNKTTASGAVQVIGYQAFRFVLVLGAQILLARWLMPEDFGLIAMVLPLALFAGMFKDFGLGAAIIQRKSLADADVSGVFAVSSLLGLAVGGLTALSAGAVAAFYDRPDLVPIVYVFAAGLAVSGISLVPTVMLQRNLAFGRLNAVRLGALIICTAAALGVAYHTASYWSLVIVQIGPDVLSALVFLCMNRVPGPKLRNIRRAFSLVRFGGYVFLVNIINFFSRNLDNILVGRLHGDAAIGLYSRAYGFSTLPMVQFNTPLSKVFVPVLSRLQDQPERYALYYRTAMTCLALAGMFVVGGVTGIAPVWIPVLLGSHWESMVPVVQSLWLVGMISTFNVASGWLFLSSGRVRLQLLVGGLGSLCVAGTIAMTAAEGLVVMALAIGVVQVLVRGPQLWAATLGTSVRFWDIAGALWRPFVASTSGCALTTYISLTAEPGWLIMAGLSALYGMVFLGVLIVLPGGRTMLFDLWTRIRAMRGVKAQGES